MTQRYAPGLLDRLMGEAPPAAGGVHAPASPGAAWTRDHLKDAVARDLEDLFNTRAALADDALIAYPEVGKSVFNYGLTDFAGLCLTSDADQKKICAALRLAVERFEPRLHVVSATLLAPDALINRVDFVICAWLKGDSMAELVQLNATLKPSTQQFAIRRSAAADAGEG